MYSLSLTLWEQPKVLTHRRSVPGTEEEEGAEGGIEEEEEEEAPLQVAVIVVVIFSAFPTPFSPSLPASAEGGERGGDVDACRRLLLLLLLLVLVEILRGRTTSPTAGCA